MHFILANYMDDRFFSHLEFSDQGQTSNMYDIAKERSAHNRSRLVFCVPPSLPGWYLPITTDTYTLDTLFSSNCNIHKSSYGLCFWASDPLIDRFY